MSKLTNEKFEELKKTASDIWEGKQVIDTQVKKRFTWKGQKKYGIRKISGIIRALKNTKITRAKLAEEHGVNLSVVAEISQQLKRITGRRRPSVQSSRDPSRKINFFSKSKINNLIEQFMPIMRYKTKILWQYPSVRLLMSSSESILDYLTDSLRWKLETFDPTKMRKTLPLENKIKTYSFFCLNFASLDILKKARRANENFEKFKQSIPKRPATTEERPTVEEIIVRLAAMGLSPREQILALARIAGLNHRKIGGVLGVNESRVSTLYKPIKQKLGKNFLGKRIR